MNLLTALVIFWRAHGTKILGSVAAFVAGVQGAASIMTPNPLTPHQAMFLAGLNAMLALWTVKRGFENTRVSTPNTHDDGTAGESQ